MTGKGFACCLGCAALGAVAAVLYMKNKDKVRPMAENLVAKSMKLKDKAAEYAQQAKDEVKDVIQEAKNINAANASSTES